MDETDPYYQKFMVKKSLKIISHGFFDGFIMFVIILNTVILSMDKYPEFNPSILFCFKVLNLVFTVIFTCEVVLKMTAFGVRIFCKEGFNVFDLFIVMASLSQIILGLLQPSNGKSNGGVFLILRTFRVFRIFKLFKIGDMRMLLDSIIFTISTIGPYVVFLFFFMYIFALVGMSFYAGNLKFNDDDEVDFENGVSPRENFDTLGNSF
jgi:Na+-transporting methylmalonyl-CoA/oxaloacetate decarboxylase gamma subunit